jgi:hypothetical protein
VGKDQGKTYIERAFNERRSIYLFLSQDGKIFEVNVEEDQRGKCSIS